MILPGSPEMKAQLNAAFDLEPSLSLVKETQAIYNRVERVIP